MTNLVSFCAIHVRANIHRNVLQGKKNMLYCILYTTHNLKINWWDHLPKEAKAEIEASVKSTQNHHIWLVLKIIGLLINSVCEHCATKY